MDKREEYLLSQGIRAEMIAAVNAFRATYDVDSAVAERIACPSMPFFGKETLEMAICCFPGERLPAKMCCVKPCPGFSADRPLTFPFM